MRINECIDLFVDDEIFWQHYNANLQAAIENVKLVTQDYLNNISTPYWYVGGVYGVSGVPNIRQVNDYYCGVASSLQVLYSYDKQDEILGNSYDEKQLTLGSEMGVTNQTFVWQILGALNSHLSPIVTYKEQPINNIATLEQRLIQSLNNDSPVILRSIPKHLTSYYPSSKINGHYIVVKGYNASTKKVVLSDCNYDYQYFGEHTVSLTEVFNSVNGRHILYA